MTNLVVPQTQVWEIVTVTGTGTISLSGTAAPGPYNSFYSAFSSATGTVFYSIIDTVNNQWERGIGTFTGTSSPGTLSRTTILASSNSNSAVSFSGHTCYITTLSGADSPYGDSSPYIEFFGGSAKSSFDNSTAILNAISQGYPVRFGPGTYYVAGNLAISSNIVTLSQIVVLLSGFGSLETATAVAAIGPGGTISTLSLLFGGYGYTSGGTVTISGYGSQVAATATMTLSLANFLIGNGGSGYTAATTTVTFSGGGSGSGAAATPTIVNGVITGLTITNPGSGYTSVPNVTISSSGGGAGAMASAVMLVSGLNLLTGGSGYMTGAVFIGIRGATTVKRLSQAASQSWIDFTCSTVYLDGIIFDHNSSLTASSYGIVIDTPVMTSFITNCQFVNNQSPTNGNAPSTSCGLVFNSTTASSMIVSHIVSSCVFSNNNNNGLYAAIVNNISVLDCVASGNVGSGIAVFGDRLNVNPNNRIEIRGCSTYENLGNGIFLDQVLNGTLNEYSDSQPATVGAQVISNRSFNNNAYGIYIGTVKNALIQGNICHDNGHCGNQQGNFFANILGDCAYFTEFSDNIIYNLAGSVVASAFGIDAAGGYYCKFNNNVISGSTGAALNIGGSTGNSASGNRIANFMGSGISIQQIEGSAGSISFGVVDSNTMLMNNIIDYSNGGNAIVLMDNPASTLVLNNQFINASDPTGLSAVLDVSSSATYSGNSINGTIVPTVSVSSGTVVIPDWTECVNLTASVPITISSIQTHSQNSIAGAGVIGYIGYLTMMNIGSGYPSNSSGSGITVTISDPAGSGFSNPGPMVYNVGASTGNILGFRMGSRGSNYTSPSVSISLPSSGTTATATAQIGIPWTNNRKISIVNISSYTLVLNSSDFISPIGKNYALAPLQSTSIIYQTNLVGTQLVSTPHISDNSRGLATDISIGNVSGTSTMTIVTPLVDITDNLFVGGNITATDGGTITASALVSNTTLSVSSTIYATNVDCITIDATFLAASVSLTTASLTATSLNGTGGQFAGMRNRIINGGMAIDQRNNGNMQTISSAAFTIDRWVVNPSGPVTGVRTQVSNSGQYRYQLTGASGITEIIFGQYIEAANCYDLAGKTVTISVDLANTDQSIIGWTLYYAISVDNWTSFTQIGSNEYFTGVSATVYRYSGQVIIPAAATTGLLLEFFVGSQTTGTWTIGNAQLELGSVATPFEQRSYGVELALCQRYYYRNTGTGTDMVPMSGSGTSYIWNFTFPVQMRVAPAVTTNLSSSNFAGANNPASGQWGVAIAGGAALGTASGTPTINSGGITVNGMSWMCLDATFTSTPNTLSFNGLYFDASAEL